MAEIIIPRELDNSALGSWAGYVYQGLCVSIQPLFWRFEQ